MHNKLKSGASYGKSDTAAYAKTDFHVESFSDEKQMYRGNIIEAF